MTNFLWISCIDASDSVSVKCEPTIRRIRREKVPIKWALKFIFVERIID
ncbi:unnamed protein product [Blumeria hordei]|uniref:Uncharacterized protein n=1 Tax=Blumeria hordei TaxID=2867405 RepID=A0A383UZ67_BLUHO|nr:unnamed protein product [Blumeria hordei]